MRLCRYDLNGDARYGELLTGADDGWIQPLDGSPFEGLRPSGEKVASADVKLLVPVLPTKIIGIARNYRAHAAEMGKPVPEQPLFFMKATTSLLPPGFTIRLPSASQKVDHEAELAVVIGQVLRKATPEQAKEAVLGFTAHNDVTARDIQQAQGHFTQAKGYDTFCPLGPWIETSYDPANKTVGCKVNGQVRQAGNTNDMVFDVWTLISHVSHAMTLLPGDVICTGTPAGVGPLLPGDVCEVEIEGLGTLSNPVDKEAEAL